MGSFSLILLQIKLFVCIIGEYIKHLYILLVDVFLFILEKYQKFLGFNRKCQKIFQSHYLIMYDCSNSLYSGQDLVWLFLIFCNSSEYEMVSPLVLVLSSCFMLNTSPWPCWQSIYLILQSVCWRCPLKKSLPLYYVFVKVYIYICPRYKFFNRFVLNRLILQRQPLFKRKC